MWGVLVPGLVVGIGTRFAPARGNERDLSFGALFLALGFAAGHAGLLGAPPLPFGSRVLAATDWMAWVVPVGGVLLFLNGKLRAWAVPARCVLGAAMIGLVLRATIEYRWDGPEAAAWLTGLALLGGLVGWSAASLARRTEGPSVPLVLLVASTGLAICAGLTGSAKIAQTVGLVCAGLGALVVLSWIRPRAVFGSSEAVLAVLASFGLGLCAHFYSELPAVDALSLCAGVLAPAIAELTVLQRFGGRRRAVLRVVLALVFVGAAVTRAALAFEAPGDEYYDY